MILLPCGLVLAAISLPVEPVEWSVVVADLVLVEPSVVGAVRVVKALLLVLPRVGVGALELVKGLVLIVCLVLVAISVVVSAFGLVKAWLVDVLTLVVTRALELLVVSLLVAPSAGFVLDEGLIAVTRLAAVEDSWPWWPGKFVLVVSMILVRSTV